MHPKQLSIENFSYPLPDEKIALYPLEERHSSRLLVFKNGNIQESIFKHIGQFLPDNSLLIFNNTKVINARIRFQKPTGGIIEIFCLEPAEAINEYTTIMNKTEKVRWKCMIGGAAKWKEGGLKKQLIIDNEELIIEAKLIEKKVDAFVVELSWFPATYRFAEVLEKAGDIPLPPYIKRDTDLHDALRFQTVYAKDEGSVAAPTAGLHFTKDLIESFAKKNITSDYVCLHVGAGTFKPVKTATMAEHVMHAEWIDVRKETIENLLLNLQHTVIAVGTTSARMIESIYWLGVKAFHEPGITQLELDQWEVYDEPLCNQVIPVKVALLALLNWLHLHHPAGLFTQTRILIAPGYHFKILNGLVTNFHQPRSTLLLMVAAAVGNDWKNIYSHALENEFRFLSYGDGCLLFINAA